MDKGNDFLKGSREIAAYLDVSLSTLMDWHYNRGLPMQQIGHIWRASKEALDTWHKEQTLKEMGIESKDNGPVINKRKSKGKGKRG